VAVNISATFSKKDRPRNGLDAIAAKLVDDDLQQAEYWGVVRVRPNFYKVSAEDGERTATVEIAHIEVALDEADIEATRSLLQRRYKDRTGIDDAPPADLFSVLPGDGQADPAAESGTTEAGADELMARRAERKAAGLPAFSGDGEPL